MLAESGPRLRIQSPSPYATCPSLGIHAQASDLVLAHPIGPSARLDGIGVFKAQGFKIAAGVTAVDGLRAGGPAHYGCSRGSYRA